MSPSFISGCKNYFPWVKPTFDKWHVYRLLGKHLYYLAKKRTDYQEDITVLWKQLEEFYNRNSFEKAETQLTFIADYAQSIFGKNKFSNSIEKLSLLKSAPRKSDPSDSFVQPIEERS